MFIQEEEKKRLAAIGAVKTGHFCLSSGLHSEVYLDKNMILSRPRLLRSLCLELADRIAPYHPDAIIGPPVGGALCAEATAAHLCVLRNDDLPLALWTDKQPDGSLELRRHFGRLVNGRIVAVVEDVIMTGGSAEKTVQAVQAAGGRVACVAALCNRGGVLGLEGVPRFHVLMDFTLDAYQPGPTCPLCVAGIPIDKELGRGA